METLVEFVKFTKGWEYIIAIAAILAFIGFWQLLAGERPLRAERRIAEEAPVPLSEYASARAQTPVFAMNAALRNSPCWEAKTCPEETRQACPAFRHADVLCWQAKKVANGWRQVSSDCISCQLYIRQQEQLISA